MKHISYVILFLSLQLSGWAQCDEEKNVRKVFDKQEYEKTIDKAEKAIAKNANQIGNYYLAAKASMELFMANPTHDDFLKASLKFTYKALRKDKDELCKSLQTSFLDSTKNTTARYALELFNDTNQQSKSKYFYAQLAKIFNDTTPQYFFFYPKTEEKKGLTNNENQWEPAANFTDANGQKQGLWRKLHPNGKPAYEITFRNNIPVGDFKRFHKNGQTKAHLTYDQQGQHATATLYNEHGQKVAEGFYLGKQRDSVWNFYGQNQIKMATEHYKNGKRHGKSVKYFTNGSPAEEREFKDGVEHGVWRKYYENGQIDLESRIEKNERNGPFYKYYPNGSFRVKGYYKDNLMHGDWVYYNTKAEPSKTIQYKNGQPVTNLDLLEKEEKQYFEELQNNKGRIIDPEDYLNNPYEYTDRIKRGATIK